MIPCGEEDCSEQSIAGIPVRHWRPGNVTGLPAEQTIEQQLAQGERRVYVVSRIVAEAAARQRTDLFIPDGAIRDEAGRIVAVTGLARV